MVHKQHQGQVQGPQCVLRATSERAELVRTWAQSHYGYCVREDAIETHHDKKALWLNLC